jgi:hypothetical protein
MLLRPGLIRQFGHHLAKPLRQGSCTELTVTAVDVDIHASA